MKTSKPTETGNMNFQNLNRLNVLVNVLSGNLLPTTPDKPSSSAILKIYSLLAWSIETAYLITSIVALFFVPKDRTLQDSTVSIVICVEVILLFVYLQSRANYLREIIEKLNTVLAMENETLRDAVASTLKPLETPLKIYTVSSVGSVIMWTSMPLLLILQRNQFVYVDFNVPAALSTEPFSTGIFVAGIFIQVFGGAYTILRKIGFDVYTMHIILLMTAQYRYLTMRLAVTLGNENVTVRWESLAGVKSDRDNGEKVAGVSGKLAREELHLLLRHHGIVVQLAAMLRDLFAPNVTLLYMDSVFRFCFLGIMIIMNSSGYFEKLILVMYAIGALLQLYMLCYCIQQLLDSSTKLTDDAFHEKWYSYDESFRRTFATLITANKLECRLSSVETINLTLPSFMSILNQSYSFCLLFLKMK